MNRAPSGKKRAGNPYGIGGTLVTLVVALLLWWFNGGESPRNAPSVGADGNQVSTLTATATAEAATVTAVSVADAGAATEAAAVEATVTATPEPVVTDAPTPTLAPPTVTDTPPATATARPAPTATKPPKLTPSPTSRTRAAPPGMPTITLDELPPEALDTLALIEEGGPFPFERDGITFQNRERILPAKPRGYYREYTVITPGERDRGARRIVAGANGERYYTDDHYDSFYWIAEQ